MHALLEQVTTWYNAQLASGGYPLIVFLMALESSIVPLPSEVVIPPAAYLAYSTGSMSLAGVALAGAIGCVVGSAVMYWVARLAGRPFILKYGKYVLISPDKVELAERWTTKYGSMGVFASRMVAVIRHLIGIPAGIVRMNFTRFCLYTFVGSLIWCSILCWVGVMAGKNEALKHMETHTVTLWTVGAVAILGGTYYLFVHRLNREKR